MLEACRCVWVWKACTLGCVGVEVSRVYVGRC